MILDRSYDYDFNMYQQVAPIEIYVKQTNEKKKKKKKNQFKKNLICSQQITMYRFVTIKNNDVFRVY